MSDLKRKLDEACGDHLCCPHNDCNCDECQVARWSMGQPMLVPVPRCEHVSKMVHNTGQQCSLNHNHDGEHAYAAR